MAKRFKFRLETVSRLRKQQADEHRRIVARRLAEMAGVQRHIEEMQERVLDTHETLRRFRTGGPVDSAAESMGQDFNMTDVRRHQIYLSQLHSVIAQSRQELSGLEGKLRPERAALSQASKEQKVLEKLEERQRDRHRRELERMERIEEDESAAQYCHREVRRLAVAEWGLG